MYKRKFIFDSILSIVAAAIPILILQLFTLPIVGSLLGQESYGLVVALISLFTLISFPFGNVLNNTRLVMQKEYENQPKGDFHLLLLISVVLSVLMVSLGTLYYQESASIYEISFMIIITILNLMREYLIVDFRLNLNYKAILFNNVILGVGYLFGTIIFYYTKIWEVIFVSGLVASLVYILINSSLLKDCFEITELFKRTTYKFSVLYFSGLMKTSISYADKLLLFPLLGSKVVSIYYTATILGKITSMVIIPINNVILSYLSKLKSIKKERFIFVITISSALGVFAYFVIVFISPYVLYKLYPEWASESLNLIYITTASAIVTTLNSVSQPFILKFKSVNWQILISGSHVIIYLILAFYLYQHFGLIGFCIGILVASCFKLAFMICLFLATDSSSN
ncbi:hypothetical protein H0266_10700 [Halobacillus locisalis]|uniref:Membrane protein involved in the export of O-antigen and teichoic acid n=1 Tax=Halobacillus locisalis TaxID=220753 RepID=A0A838CUB5_9BACI|nr:hypothetical protein [Halobacillus locisalis]MBA2175365.1 hypothetical protein [Halobacillus locisalis]